MTTEENNLPKILWFIFLSSVLSFLLSMFLSFYTENTVKDTFDLGCSFYPLIFYNQGLKPYLSGEVPYTPFLVGIFKLLFLSIPDETTIKWQDIGYYDLAGTTMDLRINQYTLILYLVFILFAMVLLCSAYMITLGENYACAFLLILTSALSYPLICGYRGGDVYIYILPLLLFFYYYDNLNTRNSHIVSVILLTCIASLEPAFLFFLCLFAKKKQYKKVVGVLTGVGILNLVPLLFYGMNEFFVYLKNVITFYLYPPVEGIGLCAVMSTIGDLLNIHIRVRYVYLIGAVLLGFSIWSALRDERTWKTYSNLILIGILYSPNSTISSLSCLFYCIYIILNERTDQLGKIEYTFICLICSTILISPATDPLGALGNSAYTGVIRILVFLMFLFTIFNMKTLKNVFYHRRHKYEIC